MPASKVLRNEKGQFIKGNQIRLGKRHIEESKKKISEALKGRSPNSGSFKKGLIPWIKGKHHSEKTRINHSKIMKKFWKDPEFRQNQIDKHKGRMPSNVGIDIGVKGKSSWMKGKEPWNKGKKGLQHHNEETRRKLSEIFKGRPSTMKGKHHTEEAKQKNRLAHLGKPSWNKGKPWSEDYKHNRILRWKDEEFAKMMGRALGTKPSKPEKYLIELLNTHFPNEWKYVGNAKFWIEGRNPDFININGKKAIIEYNGHWKHTKEKDEVKTQHYLNYGYITLNLYPIDLKDEKRLIQTISNFISY